MVAVTMPKKEMQHRLYSVVMLTNDLLILHETICINDTVITATRMAKPQTIAMPKPAASELLSCAHKVTR